MTTSNAKFYENLIEKYRILDDFCPFLDLRGDVFEDGEVDYYGPIDTSSSMSSDIYSFEVASLKVFLS